MASTTLSGSFSGTNAGKYAIKCECTSSSNGSAANTSNVTVNLYMRRTESMSASYCQWNAYTSGSEAATSRIIINGSDSGISYTPFDTRSTTGWIFLKSYTVNNISHNSDGTKSVSIRAEFEPKATSSLYGGVVSGTFYLDSIPRASAFSINKSDVQIGGTISATVSPASGNFTHKSKIWIANQFERYYVEQNHNATYYEFQIPTSWYTYAGTSNSFTGCLRVETFLNGTYIGRDYDKTFTITVPSGTGPSIGNFTADPVDIANTNVLIKNKNKLTLSSSGCSGGLGSSISYTITGSDMSTQYASSATIGPFYTSGTKTYTLTVKDIAGRTASKSVSVTCYDYYTPSFSAFNAYRCDTNGNPSSKGTCIKFTYTTNIASVNGTNSASVTIYYKKSTDSAYTPTAGTTPGLGNSSGSKIISGIDTDSQYKVYALVSDKYGESSKSSEKTIIGGLKIFNITSDGLGVAVGKKSTKSSSNTNGLFECGFDAKFDAYVGGPQGFSTESDERVKKNISDIDNDMIDALRPVQYELIRHKDGKKHYGFIAQEVIKVLNENGVNADTAGVIGQVVNDDRKEYVLTYTEFIPLLTKKCQLLQAEINLLKQEIAELKKNSS